MSQHCGNSISSCYSGSRHGDKVIGFLRRLRLQPMIPLRPPTYNSGHRCGGKLDGYCHRIRQDE
eukprot:2686035-Prorocentrum_lima.AAC.1